MSLFLRVVNLLIFVLFVVLAWYLIVWVLQIAGITVPEKIMQIVLAILILMAIAGGLSGRFDNWWKQS
jgi:hypothetical protein